MYVSLVRIGDIQSDLLERIRDRLVAARHDVVTRLHPLSLNPDFAHNVARSQYGSTDLLAALLDLHEQTDQPGSPDRLVGVAAVDLFIPVLTYVFGEALLSRPAAVISTLRLDPSYYGLPGDLDLIAHRAAIEIIHELGHTSGLVHCHEPDCAMRSSFSPEEIDLKGSELCVECERQWTAALRQPG